MINKISKNDEQNKLNFYSKYNRVKDKQNISTLYSLLDDAEERRRLESLTFTLNVSRNESDSNSPIRLFSTKRRDNTNYLTQERILTLYDKNDSISKLKMDGKLDKLQRLQNLERQFHQQLNNSERQMLRRRKMQKTNKQKDMKEFITMEEALSDAQSKNSKQFEENKANDNSPCSNRQDQQIGSKEEIYRGRENQYKVIEDARMSRQIKSNHKLREIMDEKYVESVEGDLDGYSSSIVIERMNIHRKRLQKDEQLIQTQQQSTKPTQNYCQPQLSHSQSEYIISQYRQMEMESRNQQINEDNEHRVEEKEIISHSDDIMEETHHQYDTPGDIGYSQMGQILENSLKRINEQHSQLRDQIQDRVEEINPCPQFETKPTNYQINNRLNAFHSQIPKRRTLQEQKEVQSIQEEAPDVPSSQTFLPVHNIPQNLQDSSAFPVKQTLKMAKKQAIHTDKKISFKKLMASNRANLVPRLAISTILNEHINEVLGDYRSTNLHRNTKLQSESILHSKSPSPTVSRINFKKVLQMSRHCKSGSRQSKLDQSVHKATLKIQHNRQLLIGFFSQN